MSNLELQEEEREVLSSIYDGDDNFKQISDTVYQYKYGVNEDQKSFLLEIKWGENYPEEKPDISMDTFYNKHLFIHAVKYLRIRQSTGQNEHASLRAMNLDNLQADKYLTVTSLKNKIIKLVSDEAEQYLGMSMTYSLFEFVKEKFDEVIEEQPESIIEAGEVEKLTISDPQDQISKKEPKKEQLTKAQKRRAWDKVDSKGEKPRGWNWVDIVKHLSQTGSKDDAAPTS